VSPALKSIRHLVPYLSGVFYKSVSVLCGFFMVLVLSSRMTPVEFGVYSIGFSTAMLAHPLVLLGQGAVLTRFWPPFAERYGLATAHFVVLRGLAFVGAGGVAVFAAFAAAASGLDLGPLAARRDIILCSGALAVCLGFSRVLTESLAAQGLIGWALLPSEICWRVGVILIALLADRMTGADGLVALSLALGFMTAVQALRLLGGLRSAGMGVLRCKRPPRREIAAMWRAQWAFCGLAVASAWMTRSSTVCVGIVLGPVAAGAFFAAKRLAGLMFLVPVGTNVVSGPLIARDWHAGRKEDVQKLTTVMVVFAASAASASALVFLVLGEWLLTVFDPSYAQAFPTLLILCIGQFVNGACGPNANLLRLAGLERSLLKITVAAGVANVALTSVGAIHGGIVGAAAGTAFATVSWNLCATWLCKSRLNIQPLRMKHLFHPSATLRDIAAARDRMKADIRGP